MSLLWKILLSTSLAITLLFAVIGWIVQDQFVRIASSTVEEEVRSSFQAYDSLWKAQAAQLASVSLVLSRMPDVRAAFSTGDQATIRDTAGEVWDRISRRGTLLVVTDPKGNVISSLGSAHGFEPTTLVSVQAASRQFPRQSSGLIERNGQLFQIAVTPVYVASASGSALLNVLIAGVVVDAELVQSLKSATGGSDFVFIVNGRVASSTLPSASEAGYSRFVTPLLDVSGQQIGELRILRSADAWRSRISGLRTRIVLLWAIAVALGFGVTYMLARRLVQPVRALDAAAAEIAAGNYDVKVEPESEDEIGRLARTFNSMCASIRDAREELIHQEQLSTIARLSTSIAHDLRNPLASIYGGAEMLVDDELSPAQVRRLASNIYQASRRMQALLQEFSEVRRGRTHQRETCNLREVIEAAVEPVIQERAHEGIQFELEVPDRIELPLDRSPMERVFQNLFGNAVEAMPSGGTIRIHAEISDDMVTIAIEDTGPGVPASIAARLFRPFVTAGKKDGVGLGLALARQTVRDHYGDLRVDLAFQPGARFVITLPLGDANSAAV